MTDAQWRSLEPHLPPEKPRTGRRPNAPHRRILDGILWVPRPGAPWRDLARRYGPVGTVHTAGSPQPMDAVTHTQHYLPPGASRAPVVGHRHAPRHGGSREPRTGLEPRTAQAAAEAARGVARAPMPAVTMGMIVEAVAAVVPAPQGLASSGGPEWWGELLTEASPEDVASSLAYAMRFDKGARPAARAGSSP